MRDLRLSERQTAATHGYETIFTQNQRDTTAWRRGLSKVHAKGKTKNKKKTLAVTSGRPKFLPASAKEPRPPPLLGHKWNRTRAGGRVRAGSRARRGRAGTEKGPRRGRAGQEEAEEGPRPPGRPLRGRAPPGRPLSARRRPPPPRGPAEESGAAWPRPGGGLPRPVLTSEARQAPPVVAERGENRSRRRRRARLRLREAAPAASQPRRGRAGRGGWAGCDHRVPAEASA